MSKILKISEVVRHWEDGKMDELQVRAKFGGEWLSTDGWKTASFPFNEKNADCVEFRAKPKPQTIPLDISDVAIFVGKGMTIRKVGEARNRAILAIDKECIVCYDGGGDMTRIIPYNRLAKEYVFSDGTPCTKEVS